MNRKKNRIVTCVLISVLTGGCASAERAMFSETGSVPVPGGNVWYKKIGVGKPGVPLLVLHGGPGVPHDYLEPLAGLANERPVVFYDQLGCGNSDRPTDMSLWTIERYVEELAQVRAALGLERVHILGQSWGSMLAVDYMLRRKPDGVVSLTLAGPALSMSRWIADADAWLAELPPETQRIIREAEASGDYESQAYQDAMAEYYKLHVCRMDPWPDCVQRALSAEKMGKAAYEYMCGPSEFTINGTLKDYERADRLKEITVPTLFVCGRYDEATPETTEFYHRMMPGSEFAVIEEASHFCHVEQAEAFNRVVGEFLRRAEGAR